MILTMQIAIGGTPESEAMKASQRAAQPATTPVPNMMFS
jgi:hypothetical protein